MKKTEKNILQPAATSQNAERVFLSYLEQTPLSYALWRSLEYMQLEGIEFREPVLDLGCGDGIFSQMLFSGRVAVGMDLNHRELTLARRFGTHKGLVSADARKMPFADASFATVFSNCVIEHIPDPHLVAGEVARILRPGGQLVFTAPTEYFTSNLFYVSFFNRIGLGFLARYYGDFVNRTLRHTNMLSMSQWLEITENAGLKTVFSRQFIGPPATAVFDLFLPLSFLSYFYRRLFGRWAVFPGQRKLLAPMIFNAAKRYLTATDGAGACFIAVAQKPLENNK